MDQSIYITGQAALAAICWLIVAGGAGVAVFARQINDTVFERIGLSAVATASFGAAWRIAAAGWVSDGGTTIAVALAVYVATVFIKHAWGWKRWSTYDK